MIPRVFHRIWFGDRPRPERYDEYWQMWKDLHPTAEFITWTESNLPALTNMDSYTLVGDIARSGGVTMSHGRAVAVMRADVVAYELLQQFGGVYLNCDMMPLKPIEDLLQHSAVLGMEDNYFACNAVMMGEQGHPLFTNIVRELPLSLQRFGDSGMEVATGPHLLTRCWREGGYNVTVFPTDAFYPVHHSEIPYGTTSFDYAVDIGRTKDSYAVHMWGHRAQEGNLYS